jgi:hypothetical protein
VTWAMVALCLWFGVCWTGETGLEGKYFFFFLMRWWRTVIHCCYS